MLKTAYIMTKKVLLFLSTLILVFLSSCNEDDPVSNYSFPLSQEDALKVVSKETRKYKVYSISKEVLKASSIIKIPFYNVLEGDPENSEKFQIPDYDCWLVVIDTDPIEHNNIDEYIYLFIDINTGKYEKYIFDSMPNKDAVEYLPIEFLPVKTIKTKSSGETSDVVRKDNKQKEWPVKKRTSVNDCKWAVIISGGEDVSNNHPRYWNNSSYAYKVLTNKYSYPKSQIYCLIADGSNPAVDRSDGTSSPLDLDGDGEDEVLIEANTTNISSTFTYLGNHVAADDEVFVFVTDHGGLYSNTGNSFISLWNSSISAQVFYGELTKITQDAHINIVMGQCHSGGFIDPIRDNSRQNISIATACKKSESSYARQNYTEFLHQWLNGMNEMTLSGSIVSSDTNHDNYVSMNEGFVYARDNDWFYGNVFSNETPQFYSSPSTFGDTHSLYGEIFSGTIVGPDEISDLTGGVYDMTGLPSDANVAWDDYTIVNTTVLTNTSSLLTGATDCTKFATIRGIISWRGTYTIKSKEILIWKTGESYTDDLIEGEGSFFSLDSSLTGLSNIVWETDNPICDAAYQGRTYVDFNSEPDGCATEVWCSFNNRFGEYVKLKYRLPQ